LSADIPETVAVGVGTLRERPTADRLGGGSGEFFTARLRTGDMDTIGFLCRPDHPVFWPVAERLSARSFRVRFLPPDEHATAADVDGLSALVNASVHPGSFATLRYADRTEIPTWNGFVAPTALSCRLVALHALETVGCQVPDVRLDPERGYVPRPRYKWGGASRLGSDGDFYQEQVRSEPVDYRYYAVDDGRETHVRAISVRSELSGTETLVDEIDVDVSLATRVRELLDRFDARAVAVDFVEGEDGFYAFDADPVPGFGGTEMDRRVADSVASLTTLGA